MDIAILIVCLVVLLLIIVLTLLGKLDNWYLWSVIPEDRDKVNIKRWRYLFAGDLTVFLCLIFVFKLFDLDHLEWALAVMWILHEILEWRLVRRK